MLDKGGRSSVESYAQDFGKRRKSLQEERTFETAVQPGAHTRLLIESTEFHFHFHIMAYEII